MSGLKEAAQRSFASNRLRLSPQSAGWGPRALGLMWGLRQASACRADALLAASRVSHVMLIVSACSSGVISARPQSPARRRAGAGRTRHELRSAVTSQPSHPCLPRAASRGGRTRLQHQVAVPLRAVPPGVRRAHVRNRRRQHGRVAERALQHRKQPVVRGVAIRRARPRAQQALPDVQVCGSVQTPQVGAGGRASSAELQRAGLRQRDCKSGCGVRACAVPRATCLSGCSREGAAPHVEVGWQLVNVHPGPLGARGVARALQQDGPAVGAQGERAVGAIAACVQERWLRSVLGKLPPGCAASVGSGHPTRTWPAVAPARHADTPLVAVIEAGLVGTEALFDGLVAVLLAQRQQGGPAEPLSAGCASPVPRTITPARKDN